MLSLSSPLPVPPFVATARVRAQRPSAVSAATFTSSATKKSQQQQQQQHQYQHQNPPWLHRSPPCATPYEILGIPAGATSKEIKAAYRRLARVLHPDAAAPAPAELGAKDSSADDRFIRLHDAYSTLLDPERRAVYDRRILLARKRKRPAAAAVATCVFSAYGGRNWETDQCW